jgi:hypothetical protein
MFIPDSDFYPFRIPNLNPTEAPEGKIYFALKFKGDTER